MSDIEEVKKILEGYFSEQLGEGASDDIAEEICQLFPQPLDDKEFKRELAKLIPRPCADNKPACKYYVYSKCEKYDDTECRFQLELADHIYSALLQPKIEEARREYKDYIIGWLDDIFLCEAYTVEQKEGLCYKMWQALKE